MNYANIKNCDIANGPGVRVSLFVSGCTHHCPGCFNAVAWDFACLSALRDAMTYYLTQGKRVELQGIGTFAPTLRSNIPIPSGTRTSS